MVAAERAARSAWSRSFAVAGRVARFVFSDFSVAAERAMFFYLLVAHLCVVLHFQRSASAQAAMLSMFPEVVSLPKKVDESVLDVDFTELFRHPPPSAPSHPPPAAPVPVTVPTPSPPPAAPPVSLPVPSVPPSAPVAPLHVCFVLA